MIVSAIDVQINATARIHVTFPSAAAAAHAKTAPFRALQQHHADKGESKKKVDDENDVFHERPDAFCVGGYVDSFARARKVGCAGHNDI